MAANVVAYGPGTDVRGNDVFPAVCLSICRRPFWSSMRVVRVCLFE